MDEAEVDVVRFGLPAPVEVGRSRLAAVVLVEVLVIDADVVQLSEVIEHAPQDTRPRVLDAVRSQVEVPGHHARAGL